MAKSKPALPRDAPRNFEDASDPHADLNLAFTMRAMRGDMRAASFLQKSEGRSQKTRLDLGPLETPSDLIKAQTQILSAAARGHISPADAKKMGDQIELVGQAFERESLARQIQDVRARIGKTKQGLTQLAIDKDVALLSRDVDAFIASQDQAWQAFLTAHGTQAVEVLITSQILAYAHYLCGMDYSDFLNCGVSDHLPRTMQDMFDLHPEYADLKKSLASSRFRSRRPDDEDKPPRWKMGGWACLCSCTTTIWVESDLPFTDRLQIYCNRCCKHAGWGSDQEFDRASEKDLAFFVERSETDIIQRLTPSPVMGVKAYLQKQGIKAVVEYPNQNDGQPQFQLVGSED